MPQHQALFITCPKGLEGLLENELTALGGHDVRQTVAGAHMSGELADAYRACLWSRLANKVLLPLAKIPAASAEELYAGVNDLDWSQHLAPTGTLWIDFLGTSDALRNTQFAAQKVKDAIVDRLRDSAGHRPSIQRDRPDLTVNVRLSKNQAVINLDLAGESLHRRGYRVDSVPAPLKENLAAALLLRSNWPDIAAAGGALLDPMCGSGTLLIEGAMMAADIAPGIWREEFAFQRWCQHDQAAWRGIKEEAEERRRQGMNRSLPEIRGYDEHVLALRASERNIEAAGFTGRIRVMRKALADFSKPTHTSIDDGLLITNPPYGERLGEHRALIPLYRQLGDVLKRDFLGWRAAVFTGNPDLGKVMGLRSGRKYKLYNGTIPSELLLFDVAEENFVNDPGRGGSDHGPSIDPAAELSPGAQMVANRLKKNRKALEKQFLKRQIDCYRVYDADLPEYSAAIDVYAAGTQQECLHIQEYAAPKSIDERKAEQRLQEIQQAVAHVFELTAEQISLKQRRRNPGRLQYEKLAGNPLNNMITVREGPARFCVNLWAYLDTGIFLDHRLVRQRVAELTMGKRLLNLFCYTATATVQAAINGARSSISVDMSKTYLQWARRNFEANKLSDWHELVQADCLAWLQDAREAFDVILLDPPSFSNSKRMADVLDVQRDHVKLINRCMELLNPGGTLVFSTNLKRFKIDREQLSRFQVEDITRSTIDRDFQRHGNIHQCFLITIAR